MDVRPVLEALIASDKMPCSPFASCALALSITAIVFNAVNGLAVFFWEIVGLCLIFGPVGPLSCMYKRTGGWTFADCVIGLASGILGAAFSFMAMGRGAPAARLQQLCIVCCALSSRLGAE